MVVQSNKLVLLFGCLVVAILAACSPNSQSTTDVRIGSDARLRGGPEATVVAIDQTSIEEFAKAKVAKDEYGIKELIAGGRIFTLPNNTKVLPIDITIEGAVKVRVLEGVHTGEAVWTDIAWMIRDTGTPTTEPNSSSQNTAHESAPSNDLSKQTGQAIDTPQLDTQVFNLLSPIVATEEGEKEDPSSVASISSLINQGANVNARDDTGDSLLTLAARTGHIKALQILLDKGADINAQNDRGDTAMMLAAVTSDVRMVRLLLARGAKVNIKNKDGFTALSGSEVIGGTNDRRYLEVRGMLKRAGAR